MLRRRLPLALDLRRHTTSRWSRRLGHLGDRLRALHREPEQFRHVAEPEPMQRQHRVPRELVAVRRTPLGLGEDAARAMTAHARALELGRLRGLDELGFATRIRLARQVVERDVLGRELERARRRVEAEERSLRRGRDIVRAQLND